MDLRPLVDAINKAHGFRNQWTGFLFRASFARSVDQLFGLLVFSGGCLFFDGLDLVEPGVVSCPRWRPSVSSLGGTLPAEIDAFCGVGRKP